ncbi:MAG: nucleoside hydrolase [Bacteroidales bacterium]|nr:nucleoside hydrolase [Bacteroidales bacterium]
MKKLKLILLSIVFVLVGVQIKAQVKIIFDTDLGGDADDLGALVMLHHFIDHKECELLGVMCWSTEQYAVSAIDAINRFYGHPDIPVGTRKDSIYFESWNYSKSIADSFYFELDQNNAPDATMLYRKILSKSEDSGIILVTVGPLKNIQDLINSEADSISALTGKELIQKKVKEVVMMGGQFPSGPNEWNFNGNMPGVTRFVIHNLDVPITFSGYEVGNVIKTGEVFNDIKTKTPLNLGFKHFSNNAPWMKEQYTGDIIDNATYDQTAVLYAVRNGVGIYWDKITNGICEPDDTGGNIWIEGRESKHSYLKLLMNPEEIAGLIESLMLNDF